MLSRRARLAAAAALIAVVVLLAGLREHARAIHATHAIQLRCVRTVCVCCCWLSCARTDPVRRSPLPCSSLLPPSPSRVARYLRKPSCLRP